MCFQKVGGCIDGVSYIIEGDYMFTESPTVLSVQGHSYLEFV